MVAKLSPDKGIKGLKGSTIGDFWSWAFSDILSNATRGVFAEFIVGCTLDVINEPRIEWDAYDLEYKGRKIEVKSAAYIQTWHQKDVSPIKFDIEQKKAWDAKTNTSSTIPVRSADCYVFCVFSEKERAEADVLNLDKWEFYVMSTDRINRELGNQKSISLNPLKRMCEPVSYGELKTRIDYVLGL